jgi:NAD(P)-dependent dehydrogenase (short-subunit alcohol dehydrogenase family)
MPVAIVTGGNRGLGRAFVAALAGAGWRVAAIVRTPAAFPECESFVADVTDEAAVGRAFTGIERSLGPADLLVNNAGIIGPLGPFTGSSVGEWWRTLEVDLLGPAICARCVLPGMIARGTGRIVNIASGGGATMFPYFSSYITAKSALIRFTECLAHEVKQHGVSVFAMGPGTVRTAMSEHSLNSPEGKRWLPWFADIFREGRDLPPERPAELLLALASARYDALSGRYLFPGDDLDRLLAATAEIEARKLYTLQVQRL